MRLFRKADLLTSLKKEKPRELQSSEPRRCGAIKGIVAPEISQKTFSSFEKEAPGVHVCLSIEQIMSCAHACTPALNSVFGGACISRTSAIDATNGN